MEAPLSLRTCRALDRTHPASQPRANSDMGRGACFRGMSDVMFVTSAPIHGPVFCPVTPLSPQERLEDVIFLSSQGEEWALGEPEGSVCHKSYYVLNSL